MTEYTGSRETTIEENTWGGLHVSHWRAGGAVLGIEIVEDLREYFRDERDKELGRWRDPEYPDIFARPFSNSSSIVGVVKDDEEGLAYGQFKRGDYPSLDPMSIVAYRYFTEHPEKKPWHDAKLGEVCVITTENVSDEVAVQRTDRLEWQYNDGAVFQDGELKIKTARRIWPENKES